MRVLLGLAALASLYTVNAQSCSLANIGTPSAPASLTNGASAVATIFVYEGSQTSTAVAANKITSGGNINLNAPQTGPTGATVTLGSSSTTAVVTFLNNQYVAQSNYRVFSTIAAPAYLCDPCVTTTPTATTGVAASTTTCDVNSGPQNLQTNGGSANGITAVPGQYPGYNCASFVRQYWLSNLALYPTTNKFTVQLWDRTSNANSMSIYLNLAQATVHGDPQIYGMQGQDFQVHGIPDEIFNLITYPNLQVNARFVYLSSAECHDNFTACFAHPGTYIGEEGIRLGNDKIHIKAGSFKKGLSVSVNGQRVASGKHSVKLGSVNVMSHRRVVVSTPIMTLTVSNSDKFLNQESALHDQKLLTLGQERRVLADGEQFHPEVPLHGLQGQTWRNVEYPSGLEYEGSINDYHVVDGNMYGTEFVFNQYKL